MSTQTGWFEIVSKKKTAAVVNAGCNTERRVAMVSANGPKIASVAIPEKPRMPFDVMGKQEQVTRSNIEKEVSEMVTETIHKVHNQAVDVPQETRTPQPQNDSASLSSGLELLDTDFVVSLVENVNSQDRNDITMRIIGYNELLRRGELDNVASNALVAYAKDLDCLYGKDMQCEAIKELARRTIRSNS